MSSMSSKLNKDVINHILSYNKYFIIRNGEPINRIPRDDPRYDLLSFIPIKNNAYMDECVHIFNVIFSTNHKLTLYYFIDDDSVIYEFVKFYKYLNDQLHLM